MTELKMPWDENESTPTYLQWLCQRISQWNYFTRGISTKTMAELESAAIELVRFGAEQVQRQLADKDAEIERLKDARRVLHQRCELSERADLEMTNKIANQQAAVRELVEGLREARKLRKLGVRIEALFLDSDIKEADQISMRIGNLLAKHGSGT